jgi:hypothetical protein
MIICCQEEILEALETKKKSNYLNVSSFETGFNLWRGDPPQDPLQHQGPGQKL